MLSNCYVLCSIYRNQRDCNRKFHLIDCSLKLWCIFFICFLFWKIFFFPVLGLSLDLTRSKCPANTSNPLWPALNVVSDLHFTLSIFPRKTGHHFHNFISWQDVRAAELVKSWNNSLIMKVTFLTKWFFFFSINVS